MASYLPSFVTGVAGAATESLEAYKALKAKAWFGPINTELTDLREDEQYIEKASKNLAFVKQQKEFSDANSVLMLDYMFNQSPALFSTDTPLMAVKRAQKAFDVFPGIQKDDTSGIYTVNFDVESFKGTEIYGFDRGTLETSAESVESFQNSNRIKAKDHLNTIGVPQNLATLFLGKTDIAKKEEREIPEGYLTISAYLGKMGTEWEYNTYLPESIKWTTKEYHDGKYLEYINTMADLQAANPEFPLHNAGDAIRLTGNPAFWTTKGFTDLDFQNMQKEHGLDISAIAPIYTAFTQSYPKVVESVKTENFAYLKARDVFEAAMTEHGPSHSMTIDAHNKFIMSRKKLQRANEEFHTMWSGYSRSILGQSVGTFTGFAGELGYMNMVSAFKNASLSLKENGIIVNYTELMKLFDPKNKEAVDKIDSIKNEKGEPSLRFVTYTSPDAPGFTFIVMENGMIYKIKNELLE